MPVLHLSRRALATIRPTEKPTVFYDDELKGFGMRVTPGGTRSWLVEYRPGEGGRGVAKRRMTLGAVANLDPERARKRAREILARVELGEDPAAERTAARRADTVDELFEAYMAEKIRPTRKARTAGNFESYHRRHIRGALGSRKAISITRDDVVRLHRAIGRTNQPTANRVITLLGTMYSFGAKAGLLPEGFRSPVRDIERFREEGRERYLSSEEIGRLGDTLRLAETTGLPWDPRPDGKAKHAPKPENRRVVVDAFAVAALRLLLLTGCRLREILHLRWADVDLERGLLVLPDSKTGRKPVILGAPAMKILADLPRASEYVIPGARQETVRDEQGRARLVDLPRSDLNRPWARVAAHAGLTGVRLHDLRHSFASVGAGSGLGLPIIGRLLGHRRPETTARYSHLADDPLRRAADAIGATLAASLAGGTGAEIVPLKKQG